MKKFAFLFAIVALFAMSAAAFASNDITSMNRAMADPSNIGALGGTDFGISRTATAYHLDGYVGSLDIGLFVSLYDITPTFVMASTDIPGATIAVAPSVKADYNGGEDFMFTIGGWSEIPSKFQLNKIMGWGDGAEPVEPTAGTSGDVTITTKAVAIALSADGKAVDRIIGYVGEDAADALSLDITASTIAPDWGNLAVGLISTDKKTVLSQDLGSEIDGLTFAIDDTDENVTIKGKPTEKALGSYVIGVYTDDITDIQTADDAVVAGIEKDANDKFVLTTFGLVISKTQAQQVNEAIANASAAIKAQLTGGPVALIMNGDQIISADVQELAFDYTDESKDAIKITVVSVDLKGASSVDTSPTWSASTLPALAASATSDDVHTLSIPAALGDEYSKVLTYTIDPADFERDNPTPDLNSGVRGAPEGYRDVPVDYTINFPSAVGIDPIKLTYTTYAKDDSKSSGGACDMGFGLAAAALAVVALRKRGK